MWVSRSNNWHQDVTPLEKFLAEKIIQRCDYNEIISNKHRTASGYTQLKELIQLCELTKKRGRTVKTLVVILGEASDPKIRQNIFQDLIISKYFVELQNYVVGIQKEKLVGDRGLVNLDELNRLYGTWPGF